MMAPKTSAVNTASSGTSTIPRQSRLRRSETLAQPALGTLPCGLGLVLDPDLVGHATCPAM
jgi:hypothetical protein